MGLVLSVLVLAATAQHSAHAQEAPALTAEPAQRLDGASSPAARRGAACAALSVLPWPKSILERRAMLQRLETTRNECVDHAGFLATLGSYWLEEGDAAQALLWLERALMLDATQLGARADHALALAAMGEPAALDDLVREWRGRTDIPPALWSRMTDTPRLEHLLAASKIKLGAQEAQPRRWAQFREVSLLMGYESNLDHSPRLAELTITPPDGPLALQLVQPLKPRAGAATTADLSWQVAANPSASTFLQAGVQATTRRSPANAETDWQHLQLVASASQRWGGWRAELQASVAQVGGNLNEPYRLTRTGLSMESNGLGCAHRLAIDLETRHQSVTALANSHTTSALWNTQCPVPNLAGWTLGLALRTTVDEPDDSLRPGGRQKQGSAGVRLYGPAGEQGRFEASLRYTRILDASGYSALLENNARRLLEPVQIGIEYARPVGWPGFAPGEWVLQFQAARQQSNLAVFRYTALGLSTGIRWKW